MTPRPTPPLAPTPAPVRPLPRLRVAHLAVADDPRLGPAGWRAEYRLADVGGPIRAVGVAAAGRRPEGLCPLDVDATRAHIAAALRADPAAWESRLPPLVDGTPPPLADGPCTGVRTAGAAPDGALAAFAAWLVWDPATPAHVVAAPAAVLPSVLLALDAGGADTTWQARALTSADHAAAAAFALAVATADAPTGASAAPPAPRTPSTL